jgi:ubiquinone/menaquinone biosynthesis C-methylase UbiE/DNA-binding transcriptional ArsR family regulator
MTQTAIASLVASPLLSTAELQAFCKAVGDELRLEILRVLSRDAFGVLELAQVFDTTQPGMSHHLKILAQAGLLVSRREGNSIFYRRADQAQHSELGNLQRELFAVIDTLPLAAVTESGLHAIRAERAQRSRDFFAEHADAFRAQQEQVISFDVYGPAMNALIDRHFQSDFSTAVEVGPGDGQFLALLATRFAQVIAIDDVPEMLQQAKQSTNTLALKNIRFIEADTHTASIAANSVNAVVANMVLHHTPSPANLFEDFYRWLSVDGELFITELCPHDQDWVRQSCGDLWLGFDPDEMSRWAIAAGFNVGQSVFLTQRNGFRVQLRQFLK